MHYEEALLKLAKLQAASSFAMAASGKNKGLLLARIKRLMHRPDERKFNSLLLSLFTVIIAFGAMASFTLNGSGNLPSVKTNQKTVVSNKKTNAEVTISGIGFAAKKSIENDRETFKEPPKPVIAENTAGKKPQTPKHVRIATEVVTTQPPIIDPAYLINVNKRIDSFTQVIPQINAALNKELVVTPELYKQALSYQNFKELETMLATTDDSVHVTENEASKGSYKKLITVETIDKNGDRHVYNLIVELYQ